MIPPVTASERGLAQHRIPRLRDRCDLWCVGEHFRCCCGSQVPLTGTTARRWCKASTDSGSIGLSLLGVGYLESGVQSGW